EEGGQSDLKLDARHAGTETEVASAAESEVPVCILAREIQQMGPGKLSRVAVGGADGDEDDIIPCDGLAGEIEVFACAAAGPLDGRMQPQEFFDGAGHERWIG